MTNAQTKLIKGTRIKYKETGDLGTIVLIKDSKSETKYQILWDELICEDRRVSTESINDIEVV